MISTLLEQNRNLVQMLPDAIDYPKQGILSQVLFKDKNCQHSLFYLAKNTEIEEHTSSRNAILHVIDGRGTLILEGQEIELKRGVFILMPAHALHALSASENLAFVLVLSEPVPKP
jgi:nitric oxide dioxygenase